MISIIVRFAVVKGWCCFFLHKRGGLWAVGFVDVIDMQGVSRAGHILNTFPIARSLRSGLRVVGGGRLAVDRARYETSNRGTMGHVETQKRNRSGSPSSTLQHAAPMSKRSSEIFFPGTYISRNSIKIIDPDAEFGYWHIPMGQ